MTDVLENQIKRQRRENNNNGVRPSMYMETLIVMDNSFINYHQESDSENYILTAFNMVIYNTYILLKIYLKF